MRVKHYFKKLSLGLALVLTLGAIPKNGMTAHAEEIATVANYEEAVDYVREQMVNRQEKIAFQSTNIDYTTLKNLMKDVKKYSDQCSGQEGDALNRIVLGCLHQRGGAGVIDYFQERVNDRLNDLDSVLADCVVQCMLVRNVSDVVLVSH